MARTLPFEGAKTDDPALLYRTLVEQVPAVVYTELEDPSGGGGTRITFMSPQCEAFLGFTPEDFIGDPTLWRRLLHPEDEDRVSAENHRADTTGSPFDLKYRMIARDGTVRWFRDVSKLVESASGRFWHGVLLDIDAQHRAAEEAQAAERRYRSLVESLPAVVFIDAMDEGGTNIYTSPQTEELLGYTTEDWLNDPNLWWKLVHPEDAQRIAAAQERHAQLTDHVFDEEYRMVRADGQVIWVRDIASTVFDDDGTPLFAQGLLMDVSARKQAELILEVSMQREREAAEQLRELDRSRNALLKTLSHDLREPVTAFIGGTVMLEQHADLLSAEERGEIVGAMRERAQRMHEVITHLLDLDRLGEEAGVAAQHRIDLFALLGAIVNEWGLDSSVIRAAGGVSVWADPSAIRSIIEHILDNVERHAPTAQVWIDLASVDAGAEITIEDDGPGIPAGMHEAIFEPFRQGDTDATKLGMGVGLAYAQRHAELQGGHIRAEDRPGGGARFVVFLRA